jgi:uncharacterized protein with PIN domain
VTVYLDTSALVKLLVDEAEAFSLRGWLADLDDGRRASSTLARTELRRAVLRTRPQLLPAADQLLGLVSLLRLDDTVLDAAGA